MPCDQLPLPLEFSFVYIDGWGSRNIEFVIHESFNKSVREGDCLVINMGPHYSRDTMFKDWQAMIDTFAKYIKSLMTRLPSVLVRLTEGFRAFGEVSGFPSQ